jgi:4-hydroxy-2-oxoheptanedioate aldolase
LKQPNRLKAALREGRVAYGYNLVFPSPWVIEILGYLDFDFVWIDGEHGPFSLDQIEELCRTAESVGVTPIARVPDIGSSTILRFLDRGVQGVMGPHIATKKDAEQLVKACLFGPTGERSFGGNRGSDYNYDGKITDRKAYYKECNDNMVVGALLEDRAVIKEIDGILSVPGIDYFGIGPNDFAQSLGYPGEPEHPAVVKAMNDIHERIRRAGRVVGGDFMRTEWVQTMLLEGGRKVLAGKSAAVKRSRR